MPRSLKCRIRRVLYDVEYQMRRISNDLIGLKFEVENMHCMIVEAKRAQEGIYSDAERISAFFDKLCADPKQDLKPLIDYKEAKHLSMKSHFRRQPAEESWAAYQRTIKRIDHLADVAIDTIRICYPKDVDLKSE